MNYNEENDFEAKNGAFKKINMVCDFTEKSVKAKVQSQYGELLVILPTAWAVPF